MCIALLVCFLTEGYFNHFHRERHLLILFGLSFIRLFLIKERQFEDYFFYTGFVVQQSMANTIPQPHFQVDYPRCYTYYDVGIERSRFSK